MIGLSNCWNASFWQIYGQHLESLDRGKDKNLFNEVLEDIVVEDWAASYRRCQQHVPMTCGTIIIFQYVVGRSAEVSFVGTLDNLKSPVSPFLLPSSSAALNLVLAYGVRGQT